MRRLYFNCIFLIGLFSSLISYSQDITLTTQAEVDAFDQSLTRVSYLVIESESAGNDPIVNLSALSNLRTIELLMLRNNHSLTNLDDLSNVSMMPDLTICNNEALNNINGLSNLTFIDILTICSNPSLTHIDGLSGTTVLGSTISLSNNMALTNIDGFVNVREVIGGLRIENNLVLLNLHGLFNVSSVEGDLVIRGNSGLHNCCGVQDLLETPGAIQGTVSIADNPSECSNMQEIINTRCGLISIYNDVNANCNQELEFGLKQRRASINPGNIVIESNQVGFFELNDLPIGNYEVTIDTSGPWTTECPIVRDFEVFNSDSISEIEPFALTSANPCNVPKITVQMLRARPCFEHQRIFVEACNQVTATGALENARVVLTLDSILTFQDASIDFTEIDPYTYGFDIGTLNPGQCVDVWVDVMVSCDAALGQNLCLDAALSPVDLCIFNLPIPPPVVPSSCALPYDNSDLHVIGYCHGDKINFEINNLGIGNMACHAPVRLYTDGILFSKDSIQLLSQENRLIEVDADGRTWRIEVDQHPDYIGLSRPNATVERCGDLDNWTSGLVGALYQDDADPIRDIFCTEVTGSYDPNDKTGYPLGITDDHLVLPNQQKEYRIRFQNTGTDTAFTVVIRDTLDTDFDIFSVQSGVSSHDYEFKLYGPRVLEWTFNDILLPDSTTNEPGSHGFVTFQVQQNLSLENGTELNNSAGIYFDFNDPIITNQTSHVVDDMIQQVIISATDNINAQNNLFDIYPNPTSGNLHIDLNKRYQTINVEIYSLLGQQVGGVRVDRDDQVDIHMDQPTGIYLVHVTTDDGYGEVKRVVVE